MIPKNAVVAFLLVSAVVLSTVLFFELLMPGDEARASTTTRAGMFVVATATQTEDLDLLWIANVNTQELLVLGRDNRGRINVLAGADLADVFGR